MCRRRRNAISARRASAKTPPDGGQAVITRESVAGLLLAGGQSRRMGGGDQCLRLLGGRTILDRIVDRVRPHVRPLVLNAHGDPGRFLASGLPLAPDLAAGPPGPLAGVSSGERSVG